MATIQLLYGASQAFFLSRSFLMAQLLRLLESILPATGQKVFYMLKEND